MLFYFHNLSEELFKWSFNQKMEHINLITFVIIEVGTN